MNGELKLLPCPFCGGRPTLMCNSVVECRNCPAGKYSGYVSADITAWNRRPTPAPGALPELPDPAAVVHNTDTPGHFAIITPAVGVGTTVYTAGQMQAYARAYAEQCRAGVVVTDATVERAVDAYDASRKTLPVWNDYRDVKRHMVRAALQSAFADDEGVR